MKINTAAREAFKRFKDAKGALRRMGMDESLIEGDPIQAEAARGMLLQLIDELDDSALMQFAELCRKLTGDSRGLRTAARDERERGHFGRQEGEDRYATADSLRNRPSRDGRNARMGSDEPEPFSGRPNTGGSMDPTGDRRRMAGDSMAFDSIFPGAAHIRRR